MTLPLVSQLTSLIINLDLGLFETRTAGKKTMPARYLNADRKFAMSPTLMNFATAGSNVDRRNLMKELSITLITRFLPGSICSADHKSCAAGNLSC